jgi:hypothetical protein
VEAKIGTEVSELSSSAYRPGSDRRPASQICQGAANESVTDIAARWYRRHDQSVGTHRREVLHGVNRDVGASIEQSELYLFGKDALATHGMDWNVLTPIAVRRDLDDLELDPVALEQGGDVSRLPQRQGAGPRGGSEPHQPSLRRSREIIDSEIEEIAKRIGEAIAACGTRSLVEPDRGLVKELPEQPAGEGLDGGSVFVSEMSKPLAEAVELGLADGFGVGTEAGYEWGDLASRLLVEVPVDLGGDKAPYLRKLGLAAASALVGKRP